MRLSSSARSIGLSARVKRRMALVGEPEPDWSTGGSVVFRSEYTPLSAATYFAPKGLGRTSKACLRIRKWAFDSARPVLLASTALLRSQSLDNLSEACQNARRPF